MKTRRPRRYQRAGALTQGRMGLCECGKIKYASRKTAARAQAQRSSLPGQTAKLRLYKCGEYWHATSWDAATAEMVKDRRAARSS